MKQRLNSELFEILKALVDRQVPGLQQQVRQGNVAKSRISILRSQINSLERYIVNNIYDRSDTMEARQDIENCEKEITDRQKEVDTAKNAEKELKFAAKFYQTYKQHKIDVLRKEYDDLDMQSDKLSELVFACRENIDPATRSMELCEQSNNDMEKYLSEYNALIGRMGKIMAEIQNLQR